MDTYAKLSKGAKPDTLFSKHLNDFILQKKQSKNLKALDLGCGSLRNSILFANKGFNVLSIDIDIDLPKYYLELNSINKKRIEIKVGDICKNITFIQNKSPFDFVLALHVMSFLPKKCVKDFFKALTSILNEGARAFLNFWGNEDDFVKSGKAEGYDIEYIKKITDVKYLKILNINEYKFNGTTITGSPKFWDIIYILIEKTNK